MSLANDRIGCCVPFCRRTKKRDQHDQWICGPHWRLVPMAVKAEYRRARRRARRILDRRPEYREYWKLKPGSPERLRAVAMWGRLGQIWTKCKRVAIERAMGI